MTADHQALIVGGGAAGLSAALVLGRARVDTLLVDAGEPSNLAAPAIGGLLGQHETSPASLYAAGREQLAELPSVTVADDTVTALAAGFTATLADGGAVGADRVVLATGMHYQRPELPGIERFWGGAVFHCPYCHGWEHRDGRLAVLGGHGAAHRAPLLRQWSDDVIVLADDLADEDRKALDDAGIPVDERPVAAFEGDGARLDAVRFADGSRARARRRDGGGAAAAAGRPRPAAGLRDHRHADRHRAPGHRQPAADHGRRRVRRRRRVGHDAAGGAGHRGRLTGRRRDAPLARLPMTPRIHQRHPELAATLPHVSLGATPTPVRRLEALAPAGTELWIKDDGAFGDGGWGGNKVRKLEWILPEARRRGAGTILTVGGLGTNWGLATALYGREHGIATALMLLDQPVDDHVLAQQERLKASGATLHYTHTRARTVAAVPLLMARHAARRPAALPAAGRRLVRGRRAGLRGGGVRDRRPGRGGRAARPLARGDHGRLGRHGGRAGPGPGAGRDRGDRGGHRGQRQPAPGHPRPDPPGRAHARSS